MGFSGLTFGILDRDGAAWLTTMDTDGHWTDTGHWTPEAGRNTEY